VQSEAVKFLVIIMIK